MALEQLKLLFLIICLVCPSLLLLPHFSFAGQTAFITDAPPYFFKIYSEDGTESFSATCTERSAVAVICEFAGARVNPPAKDSEAEKILRTLQSNEDSGNLSKDLDKIKRNWTKDLDYSNAVGAIQQRIENHDTGPKTRAYLKRLLESYKTADMTSLIQGAAEKESQTCSVFVQNFSLLFKKIGPRKWLHDTGPSGLCNLVKVYELERDENFDFWTMKETRVAAGRTDKLCEGIVDEVGKVTIWTWKKPWDFELPCDFIRF